MGVETLLYAVRSRTRNYRCHIVEAKVEANGYQMNLRPKPRKNGFEAS